MRDLILSVFQENPGRPLSKTQIFRVLKLGSDKKKELEATLRDLVQQKRIIKNKQVFLSPLAQTYSSQPEPARTKNASRKPKEKTEPKPTTRTSEKPARKTTTKSTAKKSANNPDPSAKTLTGNLKFTPKGDAFFYPDATLPANLETGIDFTVHSRLYVPRGNSSTALDGDVVRVTVGQLSPVRRNGPQNQSPELRASVLEILSRRSGRIVGIFRKKANFSWVETDDKALEGRININGNSTAEPGQLVVVDLENWENNKTDPTGRIIEVLGWPGDAGVDILSAIHRFGLRTSFPEEVLNEARNVPNKIPASEIPNRIDWRDKLIITIDPATAKDLDDAIWVEKKTDGGWLLAVHIADVSHYVKPASPMDNEASERGNSTYLVDRVLPMLPAELSNGLCSLHPNVDRLTKCAVIDFSREGRVLKTTFQNAVIHSRSRLSYEQAQDILDGKPAPKETDPNTATAVKEAWKLASLLRKNRFANGALDLEMPEISITLDEKGRASGATQVEHTESHQLVEECMLIANEAVARVLKMNNKPAIHRIHEDPDPSRLMDYTETAKLHGYKPGDLTNRSHIQALLDESKGSPEEHAIRLGLLKSLKRAAYSADALGHYGLAKTDYTHFTSPIRRYADLIVHRALQPFLDNPPKPTDRTPSQADLREIARHISDTERNSSEAESETKQIKLLEYLEFLANTHGPDGEPSEVTFDGVISDARPMGLMVEIPEMGVRGVVKREDLPRSTNWRFEGHNMAWTSYDGRRLAMGMKLPLRILSIDKVKRFVDFAVAGPPTTEGIKPGNTPPPKKHHTKPKPTSKVATTAGPPNKRAAAKRKHRRR